MQPHNDNDNETVLTERLSLSYPGWKEDAAAAEKIYIDHSIRDRFQEKIIAMRTKQRLHEGDRSHPHLRTLDATLFDYKGWVADKEEAERRLIGDCSVLQLGSYNAFYKKMIKKQTLASDRSSIPCLYELDGAKLTYPGWLEDKAAAEKIFTDYLTPTRFFEKFNAMKNKQRLHEGDRSHPEIVALDNTEFTYSSSSQDTQEFLQRHTGDCTIFQLGITSEFLFRKMQKKQQIHNDRSSFDVLKALDEFPFTYPDWARDKQSAEAYYADFSSTDRFEDKFTAMQNKQRLHDGDRSHPDIRALDSIKFSYDGFLQDKEKAIRRHSGDCTVLQLGSFESFLKRMKKLQQHFEESYKRPGLGDFDALLPDIKSAFTSNSTKGPVDTTKGSAGKGSIDPEDEKKCVVCFELEPSHAFIPCGHLCVCENCVVNFDDSSQSCRRACPMCRQNALVVTRIYA